MKKTLISTAITTAILFSGNVFAKSVEEIKTDLAKKIPWAEVENVEESPMEGFYYVDFDQGSALISEDTKYLISGELINLDTKKNLTEERQSVKNIAELNTLTEKDFITYKAAEERTVVYVFTDPTCPYCRMFHEEIPALNEKGITVKYIMYPRGNSNGPGYEQVRAVLHAEDKKAALDHIKNKENIEGYEFENLSEEEKSSVVNEIDRNYALANKIGVTGTPALFLENGAHVPGYRKSDELNTIIDQVVFNKDIDQFQD